ncbi:MAG: hypothetical protein JOZ25_06270 [Actinobacteria bacterium]|nr:hypothetical protein [Actinomycetota bacterium]
MAVPGVALAVLGWARRWAADDAYIDFRVIDNLLHGLGPVFNAGERVEAFTSPLWVGLLAALHGALGFVNLPWTAVVLGLAFSVAGLVAGCFAALALWRERGGDARPLPIGAVVFAALPPVWDFATSGLETGLVFAWIASSFLALVRLWLGDDDPARRWWARPLPVAVLVGLGPLIRPDLGIFSIGFLVVLLAVVPGHKRLGRLRLVGSALALPLAYQAFRMGYFAELVPNTAIAKEAGKADWSRGLFYLWDFVRPYALYVPLAAIAALAVPAWRAGALRRPRALLVGAAPVACGLAHTLYVVRVGGDFMHARLLLPGLFGVLLPLMVVAPLRWGRVALALAAATACWSLVCAIALRDRYPGYPTLEARVVDERAFYVSSAHNSHPVSVADYRRAGQVRSGLVLRRRVGRLDVLALNPHAWPAGRDPLYRNPPTSPALPNRVAGTFFAVGLVSYSAGRHVTIVDRHGLADPIGARLEFRPQIGPHGRVWPPRYRAGHEKVLPLPWVVARFADLRSRVGRRLARVRPVAEAARAIRCSRLRQLLEAVDSPLTFDRFFSNIGVAWRLRSFRLPPEPQRADRELCR